VRSFVLLLLGWVFGCFASKRRRRERKKEKNKYFTPNEKKETTKRGQTNTGQKQEKNISII